MNSHFDPNAYNPKFSFKFLYPKHWLTWLSLVLCNIISWLPHSIQLKFAQFISKRLVKLKNKVNKRARANLKLCFTQKSSEEIESILFEQYVTAVCFFLTISSISLKGKNWLHRHVKVHNQKYLDLALSSKKNIILLVPHTWAIDIPAIYLASLGFPVSAMAKKQRNPVFEYLMHKQRVQFGGRVYLRSCGIKPFIKSIKKDNYIGYYLPDEDLGPESSVFVDFFDTTKATLTGLGRLARITDSIVVPLLVGYNTSKNVFEINFSPTFDHFPSSDISDARKMNVCIEEYIKDHPEQYMWILRFLKTRPEGEPDPYL